MEQLFIIIGVGIEPVKEEQPVGFIQRNYILMPIGRPEGLSRLHRFRQEKLCGHGTIDEVVRSGRKYGRISIDLQHKSARSKGEAVRDHFIKIHELIRDYELDHASEGERIEIRHEDETTETTAVAIAETA